MLETVSILNTTKGKLPSLPFATFKNKILGNTYELSIVFVGEKFIQKLNKTYRKINKPTDILSFSLSKSAGEIFFCKKVADKKSKEFERKKNNFYQFLFVHGMVHLRGLDHGRNMEALEKKYRKIFKI